MGITGSRDSGTQQKPRMNARGIDAKNTAYDAGLKDEEKATPVIAGGA